MFKKVAQGYWSAAGQFLTKAEKSHIAFSGKLISFEIGLRFLTDYLSGDTYFRIHRPTHNRISPKVIHLAPASRAFKFSQRVSAALALAALRSSGDIFRVRARPPFLPKWENSL